MLRSQIRWQVKNKVWVKRVTAAGYRPLWKRNLTCLNKCINMLNWSFLALQQASLLMLVFSSALHFLITR